MFVKRNHIYKTVVLLLYILHSIAKGQCSNLSDEFLQNIFQEFLVVSNDLYDLKTSFNPVMEHLECIIPKEIADELNDLTRNYTYLNGPGHCQQDFVFKLSEVKCKDLVILIECGVEKIGKAFRVATVKDKPLLSELKKIHSVYNDLLNKSFTLMSGVRMSLSQETNRDLENLEKNMLLLLKQLNTYVERINNDHIGQVVEKIIQGDVEGAADDFIKLHDNSLLPDIISNAYNDKTNGTEKTEKIDSIIEFLCLLPHLSNLKTGFRELLEEIELNHDKLKSINSIVSLYERIQSYEFLQETDNLSTIEVRDLKKLTRESIIKAFYNKVYDQDCEKILVKDSSTIDNLGILSETVRLLYNKTIKNFGLAMKFIRSLHSNDRFYRSSMALLQEIKHNMDLDHPELLQLAYEIKTRLESQDLKMYEYIIDDFPRSIRKFLKNPQNCTIVSQVNQERLYVSNATADLEKRFVLLSNSTRRGGLWSIRTLNNGLSFAIENTEYNHEYMYSNSNGESLDLIKRSVFTWIPGKIDPQCETCFWSIIPKVDAKYLQLRSYHSDEYLYNNGFVDSNGRQFAYTYVDDSLKEIKLNQTLWEINCE